MTERQNIVVVSADSVRADTCGFLDTTLDTTPWMAGKSGEALTFTNVVSPGPRTPSSIPEIMTGRDLPNDRVDPANWQQRRSRIRQHMAAGPTLAGRLGEQGYSTIAFTSNPWTGRDTNFDVGFDTFEKPGKRGWIDLNVFAETPLERVSGPIDQLFNSVVWRPVNGIGPFARWPQYIDAVTSAVEAVGEPYFLWIFLLDTHNPFIVPPRDRVESSAWDMWVSQLRANSFFKDNTVGQTTSLRSDLPGKTRERLRALYRDAIRSVDRFIGTLWDELERDDPIVVFHSDHGEAFGDHGTYGHQRELYEENVHVPLFAYNATSTGTVDQVVSLRDLSDMICAFVGSETPLDDDRWHSERAILRTEDNSRYGVRTDRWKFVRTCENVRLYDLKADPDETRDVSMENRSVADDLERSLEEYVSRLPRANSYAPGDFDAETENQLRDLGYIG